MRHEIKHQYTLCATAVKPISYGATVVSSAQPYWGPNIVAAGDAARAWAYEKYPKPVYTNHMGLAAPTGIERHTLSIGRWDITWLEEHPVS